MEARHNREYTPEEIQRLLDELRLRRSTRLETGHSATTPHPEVRLGAAPAGALSTWPTDLRGDGIYAVGRKTGPVESATRTGCTHERADLPSTMKPDAGTGGLERSGFEICATPPRDTWHPAEGFATGYHIFDADTGTLVVDGARQPPARDVAPGESAAGGAALRAAPGRPAATDVFISPMREDVCWFYERGWPFLLVEAVVEDGARPPGARRAWPRCGTLRARAFSCARVGRAFTLPGRSPSGATAA